MTSSLMALEPDGQSELIEKITALAIKYRLASDYTAFVAVDESRIAGNGKPLHILQPAERGNGKGGGAAWIHSWGLSLKRNSDGRIVVDAVQEKSVAARSGVHEGEVLESVNRAAIYDLAQLEEVLLQSAEANVQLDFRQAPSVLLPAP
jgi:hypothetical protein